MTGPYRWLNTCLHLRSSKLIPYFALLLCAAFALPVKSIFISVHGFSHFYLSSSLPHAIDGGVSEQLCVPELLPGLKQLQLAALLIHQLVYNMNYLGRLFSIQKLMTHP